MTRRKTKKPRDLSDYCLKIVRERPNALVAHYLIHCYLYYVQDVTVVTDAAFDEMVSMLYSKWDSITHPHKHLLDREFLKSGFHIAKESYPGIVKGAAASLYCKSIGDDRYYAGWADDPPSGWK